MTTLDRIAEGGKCTVISVNSNGKMHRRLNDLGFLKGTYIECVKKNKTISAYMIRGTVIALHNNTCAEISVK